MSARHRAASVAGSVARLALLSLASATHAATLVVTRGDDPAPDGCMSGDCSLREALAQSLVTPGGDEIVLGAGLHAVSRGPLVMQGEIILRGEGSTRSTISGVGDFDVLDVAPLAHASVRDLRLNAALGRDAIDAERARLELLRVDVPLASGRVHLHGPGDETALRAESVTVGSDLHCVGDAARCEIVDSTIGSALVSGAQAALHLRNTLVEDSNSGFGVAVLGYGDVTISDCVLRGHLAPLYLQVSGPPQDAAPVAISRTRFLANHGPLRGNRPGLVVMRDVEFRANVVDDTQVAQPSVLLVEAGPDWRIDRALFADNRGGASLDGATVRVLGGGKATISNATFSNNRAREDLGQALGDTIGVYAGNGFATRLWLLHATLKQPESGTQPWPSGTLLSVRGPMTDVRVYNTVLHARHACAFGGGGTVSHAVGTVDRGDSCGLTLAGNHSNVSVASLRLGELGDHGGFTHSFLPLSVSFLAGRAEPSFCIPFPHDQRSYPRPATGASCDIGAVEIGATIGPLFADGFETPI